MKRSISKGRYRNSFFYCAKTIYKEEGFGALYKGLTPFVTHLTLKYALRMGSFTFFRSLIGGSATATPATPAPSQKQSSEAMAVWKNFGSGTFGLSDLDLNSLTFTIRACRPLCGSPRGIRYRYAIRGA